jgi:hypothetical protein
MDLEAGEKIVGNHQAIRTYRVMARSRRHALQWDIAKYIGLVRALLPQVPEQSKWK